MVALHELSVEEVLWLIRMSRGRLLKDPLELGMPERVRVGLLSRGLANLHGGLLEISAEGLAEATRRGEPASEDFVADRAPVMLVVSPLAVDPPPEEAAGDLDRQKQLSATLLRIAVDAAIIDHAAAKLSTTTASPNEADASRPPIERDRV